MLKGLIACSCLIIVTILSNSSHAQPCCYGYQWRYYRVHPQYDYLHRTPTPARWSLGVHGVGSLTNQSFGNESVSLGGVGLHLRLRGYRIAGELSLDGMGGSFMNQSIQRLSLPVQISALVYLIPEGRFNLYLLGGLRGGPTYLHYDVRNLRADQTFGEYGFQAGAGFELILTYWMSLTGDLRFFAQARDDNSPSGSYYQNVDDGALPRWTGGLQMNLGASFRF